MEINLIMFREDGSRRVFSLPSGVTTIGRKEDCNIRIPLADVSRRHAEVVVEQDGAIVRDLGAANGTYLNNRRVTEEDLEPGDQIVIGPVVFTVQLDGEPGDDEIIQIPTRVASHRSAARGGSGITTSEHVYTADDVTDPIAELEALASSADQTAINPEDEEELD